MTMKSLSVELLRNMALRYDHGLGCPGYYDSILGPGGHDERSALVMEVMDKMAKYVMSMFYGSTLPHTPFKGLLDGMASVCPPKLHPTHTTMTQLYEEIRDYLNGVTSCNDVTGDADPSEDIVNLGQGSYASININSPTSEPMSFHPPVNEFPWHQSDSVNPLPPRPVPRPGPSAEQKRVAWMTRAKEELEFSVGNLTDRLIKAQGDSPSWEQQVIAKAIEGSISRTNQLLQELPDLI